MKKYHLAIAFFIIFLTTWVSYHNHFHNAFHFDDIHTIQNNENIKSLKNIPKFFKDATTTSTLPSNQAYRPGLTTLNAIDYWLSGKTEVEPYSFHRSIFICFLILGLLCYFLFLQILKNTFYHSFSPYIALFGVSWFLLHTANAETINYIIARSDSFSTLMILLGFVLYLYSTTAKKYYVYFLPIIVGFFVKEPAIMFLPLLWLYQYFFEHKLSIKDLPKNLSKIALILKKSLVPILITIVLIVLSRLLTPPTWDSGQTDAFRYFLTQPFVLTHYIGNFILPINLVVDTDWNMVSGVTDKKVWIGFVFLAVYIFLAYKTSLNEKYRGVSFGMLWFLIALLPTSSFIPLSEVLNDHRTFFPYIGLFMACISLFNNLIPINWWENTPKKSVIIACCIVLLASHGIGTYYRNEVWKTELSLWKEATEKAPNNGRAFLNYGIALLDKKDFQTAEVNLLKVIKLWPTYANPYVSMAYISISRKEYDKAEEYLKIALKYNPQLPETYLQYAILYGLQSRYEEAEKMLNIGLSLSPNHRYLNQIKITLAEAKKQQKQPIYTPEYYVNLSLQNYNEGKYQECIENCHRALALRPQYDLPYNNLCCAYKKLGEFDKAIEACEKGLKINPTNELIKGNLHEAYYLKHKK